MAASCAPLKEAALELLDKRSARERYGSSLVAAGLAETALARDWNAAAERSLLSAPLIASPHSEQGYLQPSEPTALAYRVSLKRGQQISFDMDFHGDSTTLIFVDAWQVQRDSAVTFRQVASADSGVRELIYTPRRDGEFIFRAQPELLRGGRFSVSVRVLPTLAFPVQNGKERDIGSTFGDPRDGGARDHHGIDIFAPRGTPVLAAAPGTINRVETTPIGGNVVWQRDESGNRLYYAHLDAQNVVQGQAVAAGDTIGFVGNTGNARTTPPHLHFGVYSRGPVNPFWFVHTPNVARAPLTADTSRAGQWARVANVYAVLLVQPLTPHDTVRILPPFTAARVVSATGAWYQLRLPDGTTGYVLSQNVEGAAEPVVSRRVAGESVILAHPNDVVTTGDVVLQLDAGSNVDVLGRFGSYLLVRGEGRLGWMMETLH